MNEAKEHIAWVAVPSEAEVRGGMPADTRHPYDFGFLPAMSRLSRAHPRFAGPLAALSREILFNPGHLARYEREMIAAIAAAAQDCHY